MGDIGSTPALEQQLARREREIQAILRITEALQSHTRLDDLLRQALVTGIETVNAAAGSILTYERETNQLVFRSVVGASPEITQQLTGRRMPAGAGIAGHVLRAGQGVISQDVPSETRHFREIDRDTRFDTRSMIAVALKTSQGGSLGVMEVLNQKDRLFDDGDLAVLEILAGQVAAAMETASLHAQVLAAQREKERFLREVVRCVTQDELRLVDPEEIPTEGEPAFEEALTNPGGYATVRRELQECALQAGMSPDDASDLVLAAGEAATNAIKHARGGRCMGRLTPDRVIVRISDEGEGIRAEHLPNALFQAGFSTKISLGMGYTLMLALVDRVWLSTGPQGTVVQLEKWRRSEGHEDAMLLAALERF